MKKTSLILILIFIISLNLIGQDYTPSWSPITKLKGAQTGSNSIDFLSITADNYYVKTYSEKEGHRVYCFDLNNKLISKKNVRKGDGGGDYIETKNGVFNYFGYADKKNNLLRIKTGKFQKGNFKKTKEIYSYECKYLKGVYVIGADYNLDVQEDWGISSDNNQLSFMSVLTFKDKEKQEEMALLLLDANLEKKWAKIQDFNYPDEDLTILKGIPHQDNIYVLGRVKPKKAVRKKSKKITVGDYKIFKVSENEIKEFSISLGKDKHLSDIKLFFSKESNSELFISGFYTDKELKSHSKGVFLIRMDSNGNILSEEINKFEDDFLDGLVKKKNIEKGIGLEDEYIVKDHFVLEDGTVGFIAEHYNVYPGNSQYVYETNSIVLAFFSKEGALIGVRKIKKNLKIGSSLPLSYTYSVRNNKLYLAYNDYKSKAGKKGNVKTKTFTDMTIFNSSGEMEFQETLFNSKDIKRLFAPSSSAFGNDHLVVGTFGLINQKFSFGLISLK